MNNNIFSLTLSPYTDKSCKVENLLEQVCDSMNLHNYFGILSIMAQGAISLAKHRKTRVPIQETTFSFQLCKGGFQMEIQADQPLFDENITEKETIEKTLDENQEYPFLLKRLADNVTIQDNGKRAIITFFIQGIEQIYELERHVLFSSYFQRKLVSQTL